MTKTYEGMFLLDNQAVREDWKVAKGLVTETLAKHGVRVRTARRWDERRLAYPVEHRRRGTFLLTYFEAEPEAITSVRRDFDLSERVLRYLILGRDSVPEGESALAEAEEAADFSVPTPPQDDEEPLDEAAASADSDDSDDGSSDDDDSDAALARERERRKAAKGSDADDEEASSDADESEDSSEEEPS